MTGTASLRSADVEAWGIDEEFPLVRQVFRDAGFEERRVVDLLGGKLTTMPTGPVLLDALRRTSTGTPLDTLVRLFVVGSRADEKAAREALAPMELESWERAGLLRVGGGRVKATARVVPFQDLLLLCDAPRSGRPDSVMGITGSSWTVLLITIRRAVRSALDLGTGCGVQALRAAAHADQVVATDVSPRALAFARFNAALNDIRNVRFCEGERYTPVESETFDLIVCNPPFALSPERQILYRDSGPEGDGFSQQIVRGASSRLREGGFCHLMCDLALRRGETWQERAATWFEGTGCDAWVLHGNTKDVDAYARSWRDRDASKRSEADHARRWKEHFARQGTEAVANVRITMRRRAAGQNWFRADDGWDRIGCPVGDDIERGFAVQDYLSTNDDRALLDAALQASPHIEIQRTDRPGRDGWRPVQMTLRKVAGLRYSNDTDPDIAALITRCDGRLRMRELLADVAIERSEDLDGIVPRYLNVVRALLSRGILLPPAR